MGGGRVIDDMRCPVCLQVVPSASTRIVPELSEQRVPVAWSVDCLRCGRYRLSADDRATLLGQRARPAGEPEYPMDRHHLVSAYLRELTIAGHGGVTLTAESASSMADGAPRTVSERANRLLLNLAGASRFAGDRLDIFADQDAVLAYAANGQELMSMLGYLIQDGLLDGPPVMSDPPIFQWVSVSLKGWARVEQLRSRATSFTQAFIAMTFDPALEWIYAQGIEPAVREAGYVPLILSRQEHADRVDERIVLELNRSRFVVAEFTQHRPSVYFEAGYAVGRGLPVIWTCRAEDYELAHFDTRQYNHIVWRTADELRVRLHTRIKVVVG
jgi:hypothetical protein